MHTLHMLCTKNKSIFDGSKDRLKKILIQYSKLHGKKPFVGPFLSPKNLNSTSLCLNCLSCTSKCCSVCSLYVMNVKNADFSKLKNRFVFRFCVSKSNLFQFQLVFLADIIVSSRNVLQRCVTGQKRLQGGLRVRFFTKIQDQIKNPDH